MVDCGSNGDGTNRFVCPNDRQLALRAKLKTGWSVKTASLGYYGNTQNQQRLGPEEQAAIVDVIRRAEEVDMTEQERVGRLVERLENLRRNALGRNSSQCLLCGDGFGMLGAQKIICLDCRRLVCHKCSIDTTHASKNKNSSLCLICAETREIWKKSGAWFFKAIPKYILPSEKGALYKLTNLRMPGGNNRLAKNPKGSYRGEEESSSDEDRRIWNKSHRRDSSTESSHDVHDPSTNQDVLSTTSIKNDNFHQLPKELEPLRSYMSLSEAGTVTTIKWDDDLTISSGETHTTQSEISRRESMASRSISDNWNWSSTTISDAGTTMNNKSEDKMSPSTSSTCSSVFTKVVATTTTKREKSIHDGENLGTIELSLTYDPVITTLHCTVYRAKNLLPMDINGLSDPFCKLNILPNAKMSTRLRTKTVHKTRNPEFNENLTFYEITESDLMKKSLHILVVDDDKFGHDYMGETKMELAKLKQQHTIYVSAPLEKLRNEQKGPIPAPDLHQWFDDLWSRGQILLSLCYSTKRRALLVTVCKCANLLPMDNNGFSDPFVKLQLRPDPYHRKHKTSIKWKNLNPTFNEEFAFETRPNELAMQSLYITVYDKDYGKSNDYLGGLILGGTGSKGHRLKQWLDMIRYPDHRHEAWHNLTDQILE